MGAEDYEVTQDDAQKWSDRVQEDESKQSYEGSATNENSEKWENAASGASDDYAEGVADYIGASPGDIDVADNFSSGVSGKGGDWRDGVSRSADRWADGVQGKQSEYLEGTEGAGQTWYNNYVEGVQDN